MHERARSAEDKAQRSADLLNAAEALAQELGGVRFVTVAAMTERAGLHRTGVRRYYASKEELLLELAERGWRQWRDLVRSRIDGRTGLSPLEVGTIVADTLTSMAVFCDLQGHVAMSLEGDVGIERARRYKTNATSAHDELVEAIVEASTLTLTQIQTVVATATVVAAGLWQTSHPTPTLAQLYDQEPRWAHAALDFEPRVRLIVQSVAIGITMGIDQALSPGSAEGLARASHTHAARG